MAWTVVSGGIMRRGHMILLHLPAELVRGLIYRLHTFRNLFAADPLAGARCRRKASRRADGALRQCLAHASGMIAGDALMALFPGTAILTCGPRVFATLVLVARRGVERWRSCWFDSAPNAATRMSRLPRPR